MTKGNFNDLIQQKLEGLDIKYKKEYWDAMQEKLDAAAPNNLGISGAATSSTLSTGFIVSTIATIITFVAVISYFILGNQNGDTVNNNHNNQQDYHITETNHKTGLDKKSNTIDPCNDFISETTSHHSQSNIADNENKANIKSNNSTKIRKQSKNAPNIESKPAIEKELITPTEEIITIISKEDIAIEAEPIIKTSTQEETQQIVSSDSFKINIDSTDANGARDIKEGNIGQKDAGTPATNSRKDKGLKDVKPIDKPAKRVFRKRKGILWYLGFRR